MLSESQVLLLNNLIYLDQFTHSGDYPNNEGRRIEDILKDIDPEKCSGCAMSEDEWRDVIDMALSDPTICDLRVSNMNYEEGTGAGMACFVDHCDGQAYAVFAGTGGNEWRDDCVAGCEADSMQQKKALDWFESLPYENINISGHSKGGNKAMYVAIVSNNVGDCYAFDGEGFSNEFLVKYSDEIGQRASKIHLRANSRDYVNILLNYIPGIDIKFINNSEGISNASEYHCPNALFKYENGEIVYSIGELTDYQDPTMEMFHNFSVYLINNALEAEKILALSVLGELLTQFLGGNVGVVREDIIDMFGVEAMEIVLRYLTKYLQDLKISNPLEYLKYRNAFQEFCGDAVGFGFWEFLLGSIVIEPIARELLFDNLANGNILRIYQAAEFFMGGNVRGRDFSRNTMDRMLAAAKETEDEAWWRVDRWDCWYRIDKAFGGMQWDQYTGRIDEYYRKLIDINDASTKDIEEIFKEVYELDKQYSGNVEAQISELSVRVEQVLSNIGASIVVLDG